MSRLDQWACVKEVFATFGPRQLKTSIGFHNLCPSGGDHCDMEEPQMEIASIESPCQGEHMH